MEDGECYSCGLYLDDTPVCPGCCAVQYGAGAVVNAPRCVAHADRVAASRCAACGRYACAQCELDGDGCWACLPTRHAAVGEALGRVRRRLLACVLAFAVAAPAVALWVHRVGLAAVLLVSSGALMTLSVNARRHRDSSAVAAALTGFSCVLLALLLEHTVAALGPMFTALAIFVQLNHASWLELQHWRTARGLQPTFSRHARR